ncbi:MAG: HlyD family efflux transporter periplasmic adaptor subunit, partial [Pseudomonadota bacterium]
MRYTLFAISVSLVCVLAVPVLAQSLSAGSDDGQSVRGVVKTQSRIDIAADLSAPVADIPFRAGEMFQANDVLIAFDCSRQAAELRAARATAAAAGADHKQKRYLFQNGAGGRSDMNIAAAEAERARAEIAVVQARMQGCEISVPFSGRVVEVTTQPSERPPVGEPLLTVINSESLEIEMVVPSRWLRHVEVGTPFRFVTDETGTEHAARISRIGAEVDPVSQTVQ